MDYAYFWKYFLRFKNYSVTLWFLLMLKYTYNNLQQNPTKMSLLLIECNIGIINFVLVRLF